MRKLLTASLVTLALAGAWGCRAKPEPTAPAAPVQAGGLDRRVLPIVGATPPTITTLDARDATAPPRFEVKAPTGAPNAS